MPNWKPYTYETKQKNKKETTNKPCVNIANADKILNLVGISHSCLIIITPLKVDLVIYPAMLWITKHGTPAF